MEVKINNKLIRLPNKDIIGTGGEATIFQYQNNQVLKIYHQPTIEREEKLKAFMQLNLWSIPKAVITPQELVLDKQNQQVIGFSMEKIDPSYEVIAYLANDKFCVNHNITLIDIGHIFFNLHKTLKTIHENNLIVGDFNDLNELFLKHAVVFIDTDSFQFNKYLCNVGTESYIDPKLYNKDLTLEQCYCKESDWYAFSVLLFKSLLLVHPYGGIHRTIKNLPQRAIQKVTVFDSSVIYPKLARPPEILTDSLLQIFEKYFHYHERFVFPEKELQNYVYSLINCPQCNRYFPSERATCPVCSAQNVQITLQLTIQKGTQAIEIFKTFGQILFFKIIGNKLYLVTKEGNKTVIYKQSLEQNSSGLIFPDSIVRQELFNFIPGSSFDIFDNYLVFCPDPKQNLAMLFIFDLKENELKGVHRTTTETFAGKNAIFGTSVNNLFRLANSMLMKGEFKNGLYTEKLIMTTMQNQTWFDVNQETGYIVGFFRIFNKLNWFTIGVQGQSILLMPELENGETLLDVNLQYTASMFVVLRKTRMQGIDYVRADSFTYRDAINGNPVISKRYKLSDKACFEHLGNQIVTPEFILYASDNGIIREDVKTGKEVIFDSTKQYVSNKDALLKFHDSILVVADDQVVQLLIK